MKGLHSQVYINLGNLKYAYNYLGFDHLGSWQANNQVGVV
jgi:hypothetical protein